MAVRRDGGTPDPHGAADWRARQRRAAVALQYAAFVNPKAPPPKTPAFWATVDSNRSPEESELADLLDALGSPDVVTLSRMQVTAKDGFADWLRDRKNRRVIPHRLEKCGYVPVRNPGSDDGLWKISGRRQAVYAQAKLSLRDQIAAIGTKLCGGQ